MMQEMLDSAVHFGHKTQRWNPKMRRFLYGQRNGVHMIDLLKTQECLEKASEFLTNHVSQGRNVLFVCTKPQASDLIRAAANETHMPYVADKWVGGLLTNFATVKRRIRYFKKLLEDQGNGDFDKYTKKEAAKMKKEIVKLQAALGGVKDLDKLPNCVFVADVVRDLIAVKEARKLKIPVVAICDSNADPEGIDYPIPGNDDAVQSLTYLLNAVKGAILQGKKSS